MGGATNCGVCSNTKCPALSIMAKCFIKNPYGKIEKRKNGRKIFPQTHENQI
jgi:hypothetical protein